MNWTGPADRADSFNLQVIIKPFRCGNQSVWESAFNSISVFKFRNFICLFKNFLEDFKPLLKNFCKRYYTQQSKQLRTF